MVFDPNQTAFANDCQRVIWQYGTHIVPPEVSLADVDDEETREGCMQIYDCTMEILADMYSRTEEYMERPRWYTGDYLVWLINGNKPIKHHRDEFTRYLQKIPQFGFSYDADLNAWSNERYPLFCEYFPRLVSLAKERKQNLGGYLDRRDFRLFAKRVTLTLDDLIRSLSDTERVFFMELHKYAIAKGMKVEMKDPYSFRYIYKKLYSLTLHNNPARISVQYRLDNGKHITGQFERFLEVAESQSDADELIKYIQSNIGICDGCRYRAEGRKKPEERCGQWVYIRGARRLSAVCNPGISKYHRGKPYLVYNDEDIRILKRMIDVRIEQIDNWLKTGAN
jgi:hypothetical protein